MEILDEFITNGEGYYLIKSGRSIMLCVVSNVPNDKTSIEDYEKWHYENLTNTFSLNDSSFLPFQLVSKYDITAYYLGNIAKEICDKNKIDPKDIAIPFIGGIPNFNFRDLLNQWWKLNERASLWDYLEVYRKYIEKLILQLFPKKEEKK